MAPKAKEKSKPAAAAPVAVEDLFTSSIVTSSILAIAPGDEDAIRCKVVALIRNDNIEEALSAIQEFSKKSSVDFSFFNAYCLYRQNRLDEALEFLKGEEGIVANMLLQSQILFRLGKMDACVDIYQKLQKSKIDSLEINFVAGLVSAGRASEVQGTIESLRVKSTSSFEMAYNVACSLIERNMYKDAEQLLLSARRIGQETLMEEDLADADIEIELAPIAVQLAYVQQILGNTQEALESYSDIIKKNLADESSLAVSISNLIALRGPKDASDGLRKLDKLIEKGEGPLTFQLARVLASSFHKSKEKPYMLTARELASALPGMFPNSVMPVLLQAAVYVREKKANKAEETLLQFANKFPEKSKIALLARAQVAATAGHPQIAAESLLKIPDIQHQPATVATLVSLKERWRYRRHGKKDEAARLYEELVKSHGSIEALVGLIRTAAHTDVEKAESYEKQLKPIPGLKGIDVDSLEKTSGAKIIENGPTVGVAEAVRPENPGPPPDPERWLPKRERSSYRPKRKDKRAAQVRGSQGAVVKEADSNVNSKSNQAGSSKATSQNVSTVQPKASKSRKKSRK
ncbi:hypothetical protein DH2020_027863 [Rehmannia glutinosa]|uniref:Signal recognition particle subunit SRP72 n=1 Tax=Rehmannia glutinosa TaxID=99300 RepID=A0ABR0VWD6_REHGL